MGKIFPSGMKDYLQFFPKSNHVSCGLLVSILNVDNNISQKIMLPSILTLYCQMSKVIE